MVGVCGDRGAGTPTDAGRQPSARWPVARRAALISGVNPKGLLLYFAVLPQFVAASGAWPVVARLALLAAIHMAICGLVYAGVAAGARALLSARPTAARRTVPAGGASMLVIAVGLLIEAAVA